MRQLQRAALTLINGVVYIGFGSHGTLPPEHGWILGYNAQTLQLTAVFNDTPNGEGGGLWQGGGKIVSDAQGYLYVETGSGTFGPSLNASGFPSNGDYGDSFLKLAVDPTSSASNPNINGWGLKVVDYFTPQNQESLYLNDEDLGSGAPMLLPSSVGSAAHPNLLVGSGKQGTIYLIDTNNMGKYNPNADNIVQEIPNAVTSFYGSPAYFDNTIYFAGLNDVGKTFSIADGYISPTPTSESKDTFGFPSSTPTLSSNGD